MFHGFCLLSSRLSLLGRFYGILSMYFYNTIASRAGHAEIKAPTAHQATSHLLPLTVGEVSPLRHLLPNNWQSLRVMVKIDRDDIWGASRQPLLQAGDMIPLPTLSVGSTWLKWGSPQGPRDVCGLQQPTPSFHL